jgi:hypothetical protein
MATCPACGRTASEHAARGQQSLGEQTTPHEWLLSGELFDLDDGWRSIYVCRCCRETLDIPAGTTGDTLRAYQRGKGSCPGVLRPGEEVSRG